MNLKGRKTLQTVAGCMKEKVIALKTAFVLIFTFICKLHICFICLLCFKYSHKTLVLSSNRFHLLLPNIQTEVGRFPEKKTLQMS